MSGDLYDYLFRTTDLQAAAGALAALVQAGILQGGDAPTNMLGELHTVTVNGNPVTIRAQRGRAANTYTDPDTGQPMTTPAVGDPAYWYLAIRAEVPPSALPFDPASFGLLPCDPAESAAVLGVWE